MIAKWKHGLVIGRFQPLHKGHLYLITESLKHAKTITIIIGSIDKHDNDNPYSYDKRRKWVEEKIAELGIKDRVANIYGLADSPSDEKWFKDITKLVSNFEVTFGQNEWSNGIFEEKGFPVVRVPFYKRHLYEGQKIRKKLRSLGKLQ